ncbi:response regulator [uncultured Lutibacter sp.]|uniref:response regulator n=1 Tax=uncultured Lutibacter sp. TaxID=437739 RepID=UPI0026243A6D|nr:response regulator [uncultured Lutibacter sp.]
MNRKVLLIEDDKIVRENTSEILELANYDVKTADNGKNGISVANSFLPDIIVCDIKMPVLDGYGVLQILSRSNKLKHIPFIFLTAKTHHNDLRKGMEFGADDYICKPFEESELLRAIESRLKRVKNIESKNKTETPKLKSNSIFENIKDFNNFLDKKEVFTYKKNESIYCEGNRSNFIFLIKKGLVKTFKNNEIGKELITGYYFDNEYFGYASFLKNLPHLENATAITNTKLYKITKNEVTSIINNNHNVIYNFIDFLTNKLIEANDKSLLFAYSSVRKKTAFLILDLLKKYPLKSKNEITINRTDLANSVGIAKETLIRTLHDFKKENLIDLTPKSIKILNIDKLKRIQ